MPSIYDTLASLAREEFGDLVTDSRLIYRRATVPLKLRLFVCDGTVIDIWLSPDSTRYA